MQRSHAPVTVLRQESLTLPAARLGPENPLPRFRSPEDHLPAPVNTELSPAELANYGRHQAERVLPHRLQDAFDRDRTPRAVPALILENDRLRATFVPGWGGRLWSLVDKAADRELLHRNPVFQPANLALRRAWISGGIEWNMGRFGHHDYTLSPVFAAQIPGPDATPVLRLYEWDRVRRFPWQIDFWLPEQSAFLFARVRLVNPHPAELPNYWWTNIAVEQHPDARVLAPAETVLGARPDSQTLAWLPYPRLTPDSEERSYPGRCSRCSEHFFRIPAAQRKWIACVAADGRGFVHTSTDRLLGRKCFFWGCGPGGQRWQEFLGQPGRAYLEIQAGLALGQAWSVPMPPQTAWAWTEAFGPVAVDPAAAHDPDYTHAWRATEAALAATLPRQTLETIDAQLATVADRPAAAMLHTGSGWGALERTRLRAAREPDRIPAALDFPECSLGADQAPWLSLLERGALPERDPRADPGAYLIDPWWESRLADALASGQGDHWLAWYHLGVMRMEARDLDGAVAAWTESVRRAPSAWAYRGLAVAAAACGRVPAAVGWLQKAWAANPSPAAYPVAVELAQALNRAGQHLDLLEFCERLPAAARALDRVQIEEARAKILTGQFDGVEAFFHRDFAVLREGEQSLRDLWYQFQEHRLAAAEHQPITRALRDRVRREFPPPRAIDFS